MSIYKQINNEDLSTSKRQVYKTQTLDSSSVSNYKFNSESSSLSSEGSYYNSLKINYYLSGSDYSVTESRYNAPFYMKTHYNYKYPLHMGKFHKHQQGHFYSIPQSFFGQYIKPGTFQLQESSSGKYEITIKDDKYGNLYAENTVISQSSESSLSSSANYVGNIFYETGIVTINETGSYSASADYIDLGTKYTMTFDAAKDIYVSEYTLMVKPNEFNVSNNWTCKRGTVGAQPEYLASELTSSTWSPYFNTIGFYDENDKCVMKARYPQNIKTRRDIPIILKVKMDW